MSIAQKEKSRLDQFLAELTQLTTRYGIEVQGCGCCGCPWLLNVNKNKSGRYWVSSADHECEKPDHVIADELEFLSDAK